ncbi:hypothetical protein CK203_103583 [Vitis vinifera]|uniref:Integrase zinc-binding domain-containing protein n=1 Tax=Vitis vinifera TaxID=29760 RepID=A0A438D1E9_VITVI|nr:hypothetical protein CK203_103583 [Vitis vinifera]
MQCQMTFESLKEAISTEPVLWLPDLDLPFEVQTDASDRALGGVLVSEDITCWEARWQEFLADFKFEWLYRPGRHNTVADALSRKEVIAYITALSEVISDFNEKIKLDAEQDAAYGGLRKDLLRETHDSKWAGHPGEERTLALLARSYYWPKIGEDVQAYVKSCLISKYVVFIPAPDVCPTEEAAKLFFSNVVKHFGLPKDIPTILKLMDIRRGSMLAGGRSSGTRMSPFELAIGVQPQMPLEVAKQKAGGSNPAAYKLAHSRVLLKLTPQIWKKISSKTRQRGLIPKYDRPFEDLDAERVQTKRAPPLVMKQFDREIEKILDHRTMGHKRKNRRKARKAWRFGGSNPGAKCGDRGQVKRALRIGVTEGSGHVCPGKLNRPLLSSVGQAPDVRYPERGNKGFPSWWNEGFPSGWNEGFSSGWNEL